MSSSADQILAAAERATGLDDWGGEEHFEGSFRTLFAAMLKSLHEDARLSAAGMRGAELRLRAMAESRLRFIGDRRRLPGLAETAIVRPVFIIGLPRSGSTFLHSLMGQDPANRTPRTWEMMFPSPPPEPATYDSDPRIEQCQQLLEAMGLLHPEVTALHPFGAREPEECHLLMELMALGDNLPGLWRMSGFNKARAAVEIRDGYLTHRMALQNLQYRMPAERWVLKNPGHVFYLEQLLAVYPDACIVQTHRDPARVIPSVAGLLGAMRRTASDQPVDERSIAAGNLRAFAGGLDRAIDFRSVAGVESHFHDVHFRDLIADPMTTVRDLYARFGLALSDEAIARMQHWLATDDSHSAKARFSLARVGLDEDRIDAAFGRYLRHHGVALERAGA